MNTLPFYLVDSFTDVPFKGNPAGVCITEQHLSEGQMLSIAKEMGFSETAFIQKKNSPGKFSIRYFSPKMEIPLCGHATLAAAKVVFDLNRSIDQILFTTYLQLDLPIEKEADWIKMNFPIYDTTPADAPKELLQALGLKQITNCEYNEETKILLLELADSETLQNLSPNFEALYHSHQSINGVLVTARSTKEEYDFESRYFWPWSGTHEDPVTGGTHTFLTKFWSKRLHKNKMSSFQCSERTGFMEVELLDEKNMTIRSKACIILKGEIRI